ncbi:MAG: hypothetical protein LCH88_15900 [Proteobacteria bacterium]|nr:hypothetical protein [Pseudomonadota bacterium]
MDRTLFRNRMGGRNLGYILAGFALATVIVVLKEGGRNLGMVFGIMGGLVAFCFLVLWLVMSLAMKRQIAELTRRGDMLLAEMVHMVGSGRRVEIPVSAAGNWHVASAGAGGKRTATITFSAGGEAYRMPVHGAAVLDIDGLSALAPDLGRQLAGMGIAAAL